MEALHFKGNQIVFRQGDPADCLYYIVDGSVEIWLNYKEPRARKLNILTAGTFFGEMALLDDAPRSATVVAADEGATIKVYPKSALSDMLASDSADFRKLLSQMSTNLVRLTESYMNLCRTIAEYQTAQEAGKSAAPEVLNSLKTYAEMTADFMTDMDMDDAYWSEIDHYMDAAWQQEALRFSGMSSWASMDPRHLYF